MLSSPPHNSYCALFIMLGITDHLSPMRYALRKLFHKNPLALLEIAGVRWISRCTYLMGMSLSGHSLHALLWLVGFLFLVALGCG